MLLLFSQSVNFPTDPLVQLVLRFVFNFLVTGLIIRFLYYRKTQRRDFLFTFIIISTTVFLMVFLLDTVNIEMGFALGLFAIFGILRYRTDTLPVREMTYLFMIIGISVINALSNSTITIQELLLTNAIFILVSWVLEARSLVKHTSSKVVLYEKIDLIRPEKYNEMLADLRKRTGLNVLRAEVGKIDFLKDVAYLIIYYSVNGEVNIADSFTSQEPNKD